MEDDSLLTRAATRAAIIYHPLVCTPVAILAFPYGVWVYGQALQACHWFQRLAWLPIVLLAVAPSVVFRLLDRDPGRDLRPSKAQTVRWLLCCLGPFMLANGLTGPTLYGTRPIGQQMRTMQGMQAISAAIESYQTENGSYPKAKSIAELTPLLGPRYAQSLPHEDAFGAAFRLMSTHDGYTIISLGHCCVPDHSKATDYELGPTSEPTDDIVLRDGVFIRYPTLFNPSSISR